MNEKLFIRLRQDGETLPVTRLDPDPDDGGITLSGETSAFPRGFGINVSPADPVTKEKVWRVQRRLDWPIRPFRFKFGREGDRLVVAGIDDEALPAGRYDVEFLLGGIRFKRSFFRSVRVEEGGAAEVDFEGKPAKFRFALNRDVSNFGPNTRRIVEASELDGLPAGDWLQPAVANRDARKACLMNILAKLSIVPSRADRLNQFVHRVFHLEADRVYAEVDRNFFEEVRRGFLPPDLAIHATHKRLLEMTADRDGYELASYREKKGNGALQVVVATPKPGSAAPQGVLFADIDIDGSNPSYDLARFMTHCGHLILGKSTDHFKMRQRIVAQAGDFLHYDAVAV